MTSPTQTAAPSVPDQPEPSIREQVDNLDRAVYRAIAASPTPGLDKAFHKLSDAADHSKLWVGTAALMALSGPSGRRAAASGLAAIAATSGVVNAVAKPMGGRRRPDRHDNQVPAARQVHMPESTSFPSGHSGSAFAFASAVAGTWPAVGAPVRALATLVAYSRVHTGVHYPGDVIVGSFIGGVMGPLTVKILGKRLPGA